MMITYTEIEPGIAFEYAVLVDGTRIGRVRKEEAREYPYALTGRWIADTGGVHQSGFPTRAAAAEWLTTWRRPL